MFIKNGFLYLLFCLFAFAGCSKDSTVDFSGDRASIGNGTGSTVKIGDGALANSNGGYLSRKTASNYSVSLSNGVPLSAPVNGTTVNGYKVNYNIQAQVAQ